ncbi:hypothetical protein RO3G_05897 [Rhizopus delemar RA 99-880]|uniref:Uncharacterized protein n=1 Tax=Rhizopus delemar (strain RA 99-880 / ATCC MYA-4621 / FGSC 9543 / NRRL 43880) TaxID=246409 RepID=I1BYB2_RHIO9|nr:hypothetical protein RO3G_05897 [Rhizopus delemar RA 99-880]|eukprot:EIE81192.1 hypothetical protein RO3G_05897 [Rhizopus delemar RA 99-880]
MRLEIVLLMYPVRVENNRNQRRLPTKRRLRQYVFFNEEFTNENPEKLKEGLEKLCGLEICYTDDPNKPMLQTKLKLY